VLRLVLGRAFVLVIVGLGCGLGLAIGFARLLRNLVYGVSTMDPLTFAGAGLVLVVIAFVGAALPALRAVRVDPATVLRV
jgi:ABC-type antimicrobial peptide transport system permease subunit